MFDLRGNTEFGFISLAFRINSVQERSLKAHDSSARAASLHDPLFRNFSRTQHAQVLRVFTTRHYAAVTLQSRDLCRSALERFWGAEGGHARANRRVIG
ncbi:hypothetical protein AMELA_G00251980 [Ameiurus melas]|uniref:Uncharacterized protein n=1 Tax=Ameiurus melas TaxID=219545 RepID=A0A7J5ZQF3_AMEME|nr:hypothetical protein AMELA_G00251980 [Ameiurus melas]